MGMELHWFRLTLDVDPEGNPIGLSYEVRQAERIVSIHVLPAPTRSEDIHDVLEVLIADLHSRYGVQPPLFH